MLSCSVMSDSSCSPVDSSLPDSSVCGFPRQEYPSGLLLLIPGNLPDNGVKHPSLASPALAGRFFTTTARWKPLNNIREIKVLTFDCKELNSYSVQFSSVAQSRPTLCDPMNHSTPGLPVHHKLPDLRYINKFLKILNQSKFLKKLASSCYSTDKGVKDPRKLND